MERDFGDFRRHVKHRADHIREMIVAYSRRLQLLELQMAQRGNQTDPAILMEIQDIRTVVEELRRELAAAETDSGILKNRK